MVPVTAPNIDQTLLAVEHKVASLEQFAIKHRLGGQPLPPLAPKTFKNTRALHNALDAALVKIENIANSIPRVVSTGRSHIHAQIINYDPGELFRTQMEAPLSNLKKAAVQIATLTSEFGQAAPIILEQATLFEDSVKAEAELISRASRMAKPGDPAVLKKECEPLADASAEAADLKYDIDVRSPLKNHAMALGDASAALGWVVSPTALKHAKDYKVIVNNLAEDILSRYIELGCNPLHSDFAESLNAILEALVNYVEKEHPAGLRWNYAQGATPLGYRRAQRNMRKDSHPIGDFYRLMHSGLTEFILISRELGGVLTVISNYLQLIYEEIAKVVESASGRVRPRSDIDATLRMFLMPVRNEMTPLMAYLGKVPKNDRYAQHCAVFREFINSMNWCTATVQKASPVGFIIDVEAVTLLYIDKFDRDIDITRGNTYVAKLHKHWALSVRKMMAELKEYVKLHHPNELMFDTRRSRNSVDKLVQSVSLSNQIKQLRETSKSSKWRRGTRVKIVRGNTKAEVKMWIKSADKR